MITEGKQVELSCFSDRLRGRQGAQGGFYHRLFYCDFGRLVELSFRGLFTSYVRLTVIGKIVGVVYLPNFFRVYFRNGIRDGTLTGPHFFLGGAIMTVGLRSICVSFVRYVRLFPLGHPSF